MVLSQSDKKKLKDKANLLRKHTLDMTYNAQSGHPGGSFSLAEIMSVLYFYDLKYDVNNPNYIDRDRVVLSKGHGAPILYAALGEAGFFSKDEFLTLRKPGGMLQGHPCIKIPGVDFTTGSLGLGLSAACGMALAAKISKKSDIRICAIMGDGELNEGQIWEAAMSAAHFKLDNLTGIVDRNRYQNSGRTADIMKLGPLGDKWRSFGWNVIEIDGHDTEQIVCALQLARSTKEKPTMIIANTVKGKGASYLIDKPELHYLAPTKEQREQALKELGF